MSETDEKGTGALLTDTGLEVPDLELQPSHFLDCNTVIYGPTKTGKTTIVKHIMKLVSPYIDQGVAIVPTSDSNGAYDDILPAPLIHTRLYIPGTGKNSKKDDSVAGAVRFLETIVERQELMAKLYRRANNLETLSKLFSKISKQDYEAGRKAVTALNARRDAIIGTIRRKFDKDKGASDEKAKVVNEKFKQFLILLYKKFIVRSFHALRALRGLTEDERYTLEYLHFNPRILLIFDDCAAQLRGLFNKEVFRKVFYQGRHAYISSVICCQDYTDLPANLRKSALVSMFTTDSAASSNIEGAGSKFSKTTKQYVSEIIPTVFEGLHRKLIYMREDESRRYFYHFTARKFPSFHFGSAALHELCDVVKSQGTTLDRNNRFFEHFALST